MRAPEHPAQFAFRIAEASGDNLWYAAFVATAEMSAAIAREIGAAANDLDSDSAVVEEVGSPEAFENAVRGSIRRTWIGFGFDRFDEAAWAKLDRDRTRLERSPARSTDLESAIVVLVLSEQAYGTLQACAPNLASWIGGSVFGLEPEGGLSTVDREARLEELRRWGSMTDDEMIRNARAGTLRPDPYFAEWLVLLGRGDLLDDA